MAKKRRGRPRSTGAVAAAAETVGTTLGRVMAKVDAWMAQRQEIANELRAAADKIMSGESPLLWQPGAGGRKTVADVGEGPKRRTMSAAARKRISEAQKARWAKQKAQTAKPKTRKSKGGDVGKG